VSERRARASHKSPRQRPGRSKQPAKRGLLVPIGAGVLVVAGVVGAFLRFRASEPAPVLDYEVVNVFPHDPGSYTQGLIFRDPMLFESAGRYGRSELRRVSLETGEVLQRRALDPKYFAEGLADWDDELIQLTWQSGVGFVYDLATLDSLRTFGYPGEGWGLARGPSELIMSDGTATLRFLDPETLVEKRRVDVKDGGRAVTGLNELEMVGADLLANIWQTNQIVLIDPANGRVKARLDLTGLLRISDRTDSTDVLNGIAYDAQRSRLFVTGKLWPKLFEIRLKQVN
jgi:glutaminyl-peptide cyclotransferase